VQHDGVWYSKGNVIEKNLVAVYGTLKKGNSNYWNYLADSQFVGTGETADKYPLIVKGLPYLINHKGVGYNVDVDVFNVSDDVLKALDRLEGHPRWYKRAKVNTKVGAQTLSCWIYFMEGMDVGREDKIYKSYKQSYKHEVITADEAEVDLFCVNCLNEVEHDELDVYFCKSCGSWFTENELLEFNGVFEDTDASNELPF
jgi:gamma-glutamylaminecyclotransferase